MFLNVEEVETLAVAPSHLALEWADPEAVRRRVLRREFYSGVKRAIDVSIILLCAPAVLPVFILVMLAVCLCDGGPMFFVQSRVGLNGRSFMLFKFRTMRDGMKGAADATRVGDARITPLGHILRRTHLDELPQLWNVLRGDMSLIGPRPEQTTLVADYKRIIPHYELRHLVRPGLSGWSQVYFGYAATAEETRTKLEYDLYYLQNYGLVTDIVVFVRTLAVYLNPRYVR